MQGEKDEVTKLIFAAAFRRRIQESMLSSKQLYWRVVHLYTWVRPSVLYLHTIIEPREEVTWAPQCFDSIGLIARSATDVAAARAAEPKTRYALIYSPSSDTLQLDTASSDYVLEEQEWMHNITLLYTNLIVTDPVSALRKSLSHLILGNLNAFPVEFKKDKIKTMIPEEQISPLMEKIKMSTRKDGFGTLAEAPVIYVRLLFTSQAPRLQSQITFSPVKASSFNEFFEPIFVEDMLKNPSLLDEFLTHLFANLLVPASRIAEYDATYSLLRYRRTESIQQLPSKHFFRAALTPKLHPDKLRGIHLAALSTLQGPKDAAGPHYIYFHYNQDGNADEGWGCAYRSLQTLASFIVLNTNAPGFIPNIRQIQEALVEMGDKPTSFVGSREWIGSFEVSFVLKHIFDVDSNILHAPTGDQVTELLPALRTHFEVFGTPVMIGGGQLAYTLLAVAENSEGNAQFLILDPHYKGPDDLKTVLNPRSKALYWTDGRLFNTAHFYNICCPNI